MYAFCTYSSAHASIKSQVSLCSIVVVGIFRICETQLVFDLLCQMFPPNLCLCRSVAVSPQAAACDVDRTISSGIVFIILSLLITDNDN